MQLNELGRYQQSVSEIKTEINKYSNASVLMRTIESLYIKNPNSMHGYMRLPWNSVLLLKWRLCNEFSSSGGTLSLEKFVELVNRLHRLQSKTVDLKTDDPTLNLRPILINQIFYQQPIKEYLSNLTRLFMFFNEKTAEAECCRKIFHEHFGLEFSTFYILARGIISNFESGERISISLDDFFCAFFPYVSKDDLVRFVNGFSFTIKDSPSFLSEFKRDDTPLWEYFENTPFGRRPLVLHEGMLYCIHPKILVGAFCNAVPEILKKAYQSIFKEKYGVLQERYIRYLLDGISDKLIGEEEIRNLYVNRKAKVVDYLLDEGDIILVESKAIEPTSIVNTSSDPITLEINLRDSFIKAIHQGQESCFQLKKSGKFNSVEFFLLIVTNREYYISSASYVHRYIDQDLHSKVKGLYGEVPIPFGNIFYITLGDLENIKLISGEKGIKLSSMIRQWNDKQAIKRDNRINTTHYISDCQGSPEGISIVSEFDSKVSPEIFNIICRNLSFNRNKDSLTLKECDEFLSNLE